MKVVIAGCRDYNDYTEGKEYIEKIISSFSHNHEITILSGNCTGADKIGEAYAAENGFAIELYPAEWEKYGRYAGPKRNQKMAEASDIIICFWDGKSKGTASMIKCAKKLGKAVYIKRIDDPN